MAKDKFHASTGILFPACLFLGLGIGMVFGHAGVGVILGMGIGFIAMALVRVKSEPMEVKLPSSTASYFIILLGLFFIILGSGIIFFPDMLFPYILGVFIALLGIGFFIFGIKSASKGKK